MKHGHNSGSARGKELEKNDINGFSGKEPFRKIATFWGIDI